MLGAILNKSWGQHSAKQQLYGHLPLITKTIKVRRTRHAGHCWRSSDELISDVLLWTPSHGRAKAGRPARTYIQQFCEDTGCSPEDLPEAMSDREKWRERSWDIHAVGTARWWWWWWLLIYLHTVKWFHVLHALKVLFAHSLFVSNWLVDWIYGISTLLDYLMPNPVYTNIKCK